MWQRNRQLYAVSNDTFAVMPAGWRHSYVFFNDADMNKIKFNSDVERGVVVIDLGSEHAGCELTIYSGRFSFNADDGEDYTLVVR